ncbi:hypothetical protein QBC39DRAFT_67019 [Podospora conica]|nr:hypothetical protein QBC39DRAFT_67019 [Schizothecium conicum]
MSYRPSDAYSRRPHDDDRDRREGRRREDRDRSDGRSPRSPDDFPRERFSPSRERDPLARSGVGKGSAKTAAPVAIKRAQEPAKSSKPSQAIATPSNSTPKALGEAINMELEAWEKYIAKEAKFQMHQDNFEKAAERRQREYAQTKDRHAEFPASVELQNKYLRRDEEERRKLKAATSQNNLDLQKIRGNLARKIAQATSLVAPANPPPNKDLEGQLPAVKLGLIDTKKELADLRKALDDQKSNSVSIAELQTQFQKQLDEHKADNAVNQAQVVKSALEAQKLELSKDREEARANEAALRNEVSSLQSEVSSLRSEASVLRDETSSLRSAVAALTQKLNEFVDQSKQRDQQRDQQLEEVQTLVSTQGEKLSNIDLMDWERVNDGVTIELPSLQAKVDGLFDAQQHRPGSAVGTNGVDAKVIDMKLGMLQTECRKMLQEHQDKQETMNNMVLGKVAEWVDELRAKDDSLQRDLSALSSSLQAELARVRAPANSRSASPGQRPPAPGSGAATPAELPPNSTRLLLDRIDKTERAVSHCGGRLVVIEKQLAGIDWPWILKKMEAVSHQTVVLQSRWDNLSTKDLTDRIIGQFQNIYAPAKVTNDIVYLSEHAQTTSSKLTGHDANIDSIKQELAAVKSGLERVVQRADQAKKSEEAEDTIEVQEAPDVDRATKKRKLREHNADRDRAGDEQLRKRISAANAVRLSNGH